MAYNWAQLAFVEKWRLQAVRGSVVGMHRPADRTFFDLRLRPGEGNVGAIPSTMDIHLQDAGDIIREKRVGLLNMASVVIRAVGTASNDSEDQIVTGRPKRLLEVGSVLSAVLVRIDGDVAQLDAGFPILVQLPEPLPDVMLGQTVRVSITESPKGFLVV